MSLKEFLNNSKISKIGKYEPLLLFLVKAVCFYYGLLLLYKAYVGLADPRGQYTLPAFLEQFNLILLITRSYVICSEFIVNLMGFQTESFVKVLRIVGSGGVRIEFACLGIELMIAFVALISAYPISVVKKFRIRFFSCLSGIVVIYILNVIRVTTILLTNYYSNRMTSTIHDVFNYVVYFFIFISFVWYITRFGGTNSHSSASVSVSEV